MRSKKKICGLSLLELLISLALFGLLLSVLYPGFSIAIKTWHKIEYENGPSELYAVEHFLRQRVQQTLPVFEKERSSRRNILAFRGTYNEIKFLSTLPRNFGIAGLYESRLTLVDTKAGQQLNYQYQLQRGDKQPSSEFPTKTILDHLEAAEFEFFNDKTKQWERYWESDNRLPNAVRFRFESADGQIHVWVIPLRASAAPLARPKRAVALK